MQPFRVRKAERAWSPRGVNVRYTSSASAPLTTWVYQNGAFSWAGDFNWNATINTQDTAGVPVEGPYDISYTAAGTYGAVQPYVSSSCSSGNTGPCFDTSSYQYLVFYLKPTVANQTWALQFDHPDGTHDGNVVNPAAYGPAPVVGQWGSYSIPLSAFGFTNPLVKEVYIQDTTGLSSDKWYVDDVGFQ